jgi:hypothetical protein
MKISYYFTAYGLEVLLHIEEKIECFQQELKIELKVQHCKQLPEIDYLYCEMSKQWHYHLVNKLNTQGNNSKNAVLVQKHPKITHTHRITRNLLDTDDTNVWNI